MADYDSDSSLSDVESGVSTNVLLGYATKDAVDDSFSRLGGQPSWLDPQSPPPGQLARCKNCKSFMALLLQLNANLPSKFPGHDRSLYIWACRKKICRRKEGSIRGFRSTKLSPVQPAATVPEKSQKQNTPSAHQQDIGSSLFGATPFLSSGLATNPFSVSATSAASPSSTNPFSTAPAPPSSLAAKPPQRPEEDATADLPQTFAQKARLTSPASDSFPTVQPEFPKQEPWPPSTEFQKPFPSYFLDADYEYLSPNKSSTSNEQTGNANASTYESLMDVEGSSAADKAKEDSAAYESAHDKTFQHFADTLAQNPEQVLRYEFEGTPLLYSSTDAVGKLLASSVTVKSNAKITTEKAAGSTGLPKCSYCNAKRVFELQLTPHAIAELEAEEEAATLLGEGMEWGTVIMAVCGTDCGGLKTDDKNTNSIKYVEEWIGVQWEEVVERSSRQR